MKIILDLDTGIDDALALAYVLACPEVELLGITATYGNVTVEESVANTRALLEFFGRPEIPVFAGLGHAEQASDFSVLEISRLIHGDNGIGNVQFCGKAESAGDAAQFLCDSVRKYNDLIIVATGPMTNIATALRQDPDFIYAQVVMMGGALTVPGNVNAWSEANVSQDPDAADFVLRSGMDVTMIGLDVTLQTLLTKKDTATLRGISPQGDLLADMADYYIGAYAEIAPHLAGCGLHDPLAAAVAINPALVMCLPINLSVDTTGPTRGRTIGDPLRPGPYGTRTRVAVGVETNAFHTEFMTRLRFLAKGFRN